MYKQKSQLFSIFILLGLIVIFPQTVNAADYSHGDACAAAGAWHQTNDANGNDFLICDGSNWKSALYFDKTGNNIRLDNDPASGAGGCIKYDGTGGKLQFSHDCSAYSDFGGGSGLWSDSGSGYIQYSSTLGGMLVAPIMGQMPPQGAVGGSGGGATPGGADTQIQFNDGGSALGGDADFVWNKTTNKLTVTGDIDYTGVITDVSDRTLKENIVPLEHSLEGILTLQGVSFTMKGDESGATELGLIAQDVEPVFPALVKTKDSGLKTLNYIGLIAPLVEAVKEQQATIETLKQENAALDARLKALEAHYGTGGGAPPDNGEQ